ncbi:MAG: glycine cleavage system aminomethyltransferase GcvT [bacterium]|nr:glycine cleavage system aminomethyltransferase GcvT [bacterium]
MQKTSLFDEHEASGGKVVDFHGWALPVQFAGIVQEHAHTRTKASIFDCSHMGEFRIRGAEAIRTYDRLVCSNVVALAVGRARYGAMLAESGGIIDDVISMRLADDELLVVTNAGPLEHVSALIREGNPGATEISAQTSKVDVQGPLSRDILVGLGLPRAADLKYFRVCQTEWRGTDVILSRTGYTGEMGFEIYIPNAEAPSLWRALLEHEAVKPAGLGARDTLRTEMGYPLSGQDFDQSRTPLELGMNTFVAWDTEFTGKEALEAKRDAGGYPVITPIRTATRQAPRHGFEVYDGDETVGVVASGTFGPSVGHGIGLAFLPKALAAPGTALTAGPRRIPIETTELPFYRHGTCRN